MEVPDDDRRSGAPGLQRLIDRFRHRDDTEHEQILIRIGIGTVIAAILGGILAFGDPSPSLILCTALAAFLLAGALGFLAHLLWRPAVNPVRRCLAMLLDIGCLSVGMILGGEAMVPLYPLFLWVIFGMGFRYGRNYLLISAVMALIGFGTVIASSEYWRNQPLLAASLLLALLILPAYASTLLKKLTEALEKAEESNRAKTRFLATMSHELRTPLNAIFGMSDLLDSGRLNASQRDMVSTVRSAGRTLLELIDDLLDVARIESGRLEPQKTRFDLHVTLAVVLRLLRHQAAAKGLDLRARYDPDLPRLVIGTERWLKQILINLIGNAIKFTNDGEIVLGVHVRRADDERVDIVFDVADTGIGIPQEAQERIFERFSQADETTSRHYGGSGLGLSIARELASIMGGTLSVRSTLGKGACFRLAMSFGIEAGERCRLAGRIAIVGDPERAFDVGARLQARGAETSFARQPSEVLAYLANAGERRAVLFLDDAASSMAPDFGEQLRSWFQGDVLNQVLVHRGEAPMLEGTHWLSTLPADAADDLLFNVMHAALAASDLPQDGRAVAAPSPRRCRILVAEDNLVNQKVIRKMLASGGHAVVLAENGETMLDRLEQQRFDLVFVDLNMPVMSGLDAVKLHRMGVGTDHPPFIALTADATDESRQACDDAGFAGYLTKPLEMRDVVDAIDRLSPERRHGDVAAATKIIRHPRFADSQASIDVNHLRNLRALDPDPAFFTEIVNDFIDDARGLIDEIEAAAEAVDDILYRDRNHALHSSAAHIGAVGLCRLCQQSRHAGPDQLREEGAANVERIRLEFHQLSAEFRALLGEDDATGLEGKG